MSFESKNKLLLDFLNQHKDLFPQGSTGWKLQRMLRVGGSEIGSITGTNYYNKIHHLVAMKSELKEFQGNIWTMIGNVFESIVTSYTGYILKARIYDCAGSIPGIKHEGVVIQSHSPDGMATVSNKFLKENVFVNQEKQEEFKSIFVN